MVASIPRVSIGLPVYNGEGFLKEALESLLRQTYREFELIISDNASSDLTEEICRDYAGRDERIRYYRNDNNVGAAKNFNQTFELATGKYFKWAAHDDICAPEFMARCVEVLDRDPAVVLCFSRTIQIDHDGNVVKQRNWELPDLDSRLAHKRFGNIVANLHGCEAVFGLIRADVLRRTPLIGNYIASDRVLLALLSLYGQFHELPDYLFFQREHAGRSVKGKDHEVTAWFDPRRREQIVFPLWRMSWEYFLVAAKGPLNWAERLRCMVRLLIWAKSNWINYRWDLSAGVDRVLLLRHSQPVYRPLERWVLSDRVKLPKKLATAIALVVMLIVEGIRWAFKSDALSPRYDKINHK